jgi:hypothetical protein
MDKLPVVIIEFIDSFKKVDVEIENNKVKIFNKNKYKEDDWKLESSKKPDTKKPY